MAFQPGVREVGKHSNRLFKLAGSYSLRSNILQHEATFRNRIVPYPITPFRETIPREEDGPR